MNDIRVLIGDDHRIVREGLKQMLGDLSNGLPSMTVRAEAQTGPEVLAAVREASLTRLRPVLMTSVATVFGHLPLVFVSGPGSEARNSIGTVLVSGMTIGTLFTLFVVPVFYTLIAAQHHKSAIEHVDEVPTGVLNSQASPA